MFNVFIFYIFSHLFICIDCEGLLDVLKNLVLVKFKFQRYVLKVKLIMLIYDYILHICGIGMLQWPVW